MKEIEVKILDVNPASVRRRLKSLGAKKIFGPVLVRELFFEHPDVPAKKRGYTSFRLRLVGREVEITVKTARAGGRYKVQDEREIVVNDFAAARALIEALGFRVFRTREKKREEYRLGAAKVEIDEYPGLAPYLEVEAKTKREVAAAVAKLGFTMAHASTATATELLVAAGLNG